MTGKALSPTQLQVIDQLRHHQVSLIRVEGGFWTYRGCPKNERDVPEWWVTIQTVRALEHLGLLQRIHRYEEWRDDRVLTGAVL